MVIFCGLAHVKLQAPHLSPTHGTTLESPKIPLHHQSFWSRSSFWQKTKKTSLSSSLSSLRPRSPGSNSHCLANLSRGRMPQETIKSSRSKRCSWSFKANKATKWMSSASDILETCSAKRGEKKIITWISPSGLWVSFCFQLNFLLASSKRIRFNV